ncbi:DUF1028 domain-containing protein [Siccirubricoccus sp. KC 17139]|uniref:DUF1028 domain-containing protein n=1 Tax=Siccirubricoccus soli TaxID=2899147 RepID=A0ABT1DA35_9PROT|nr:DUF1028 domain-containing protein [Siccirubricoccus soli]MCO6418773.1 DUF1028 domain-containing protein [Siccirubricoccus soli]MCP2684908.1 DUF1028 domain-containing protein [Siccirubricoccus soli]
MTFSLIARCPRTGQIGAAVTTSSIAVGSRCAFAAAGVGAVLTQHRTDPRLGPRGLDLLRSGCTAEETVAALSASTPHAGWRQLAVLDAAGRTAHVHGAQVKPERNAAHGEGVVAIGNILSSDQVPAAMVAGFLAAANQPLAERLLRALEAGEAAGGEHGEVTSASLLVMWRESFPYVDLRADKAAQPLAALRALWTEYAPLAEGFVARALAPDDAPVI